MSDITDLNKVREQKLAANIEQAVKEHRLNGVPNDVDLSQIDISHSCTIFGQGKNKEPIIRLLFSAPKVDSNSVLLGAITINAGQWAEMKKKVDVMLDHHNEMAKYLENEKPEP